MVNTAPLMVDGNLADWTAKDRIDRELPVGYAIYARAVGDSFVFALKAPDAIGANTTAWLNTDRNTATGYQIFGFAGGAEYNVNIDSNGVVSLFKGNAGETLVLSGLTAAWSADRTVLEFAVPKAAIGNPTAIDTLYDVNNSVFLPGSYSSPGFTVFNETGITPAADHRIAILWSETTAKAYFSETAYTQLFMAAQSQAMQAGVPFDIIQESDLTNLTTLAKYDTIVFPSFRNVKVDQVAAITATLEQATKQFGIGLIAGGEFMTNAADGSALAGDSYARMKLLFDATRVTGGTGDVTIKASDTSLVLDGYDQGQVIHEYKGIGWNAFTSASGTGTTIATETVGGQTYSAALATQTGGRNVLFSTEAVMADENLLQKAIDYSVNGSGLSVGLQMTRNTGMVGARVDMDQSQQKIEVNPDGSAPGIYDKLMPILAAWKAQYNFVGSYYVNVGNDPANGQTTDWAVSLPYYKQFLDMGNELGLHSYTHPENTNLLTAAQIAFEFGDERKVLEAQLKAYLGTVVSVGGAAVPGAPETLATSQEILKHVDYLSGGYSGVGAGYPNAFGFMPTIASSSNLIVNGSFEQASVAANSWRTNTNGQVAGWTGSGAGIEVWNNGYNGVTPSNGANVVEVDGQTGALSQSVKTAAGQAYNLSFDFAGRPGALASSKFEVVWNGTVIATIAPTNSTMTTQKLTVTGTGGTDTLSFRAVAGDTDGLGALLDNVSLVGQTSGTAFEKVYLAPNTFFDFTLMEFQKKTVAEAEAFWAKEFQTLTAKADAPVIVWPWHDYGPAMWSTGGTSPYVTSMFTNWIARAAAAGMEFVTLADLADRIAAFQKSTITSSVVGNTITATVSASAATGNFSLDVDGQGSSVIQKVANWYAYSADKVFLPQSGGTFTITIGAAADDVTHIISLPMRADLISLSGDGRSLSFSATGEGQVVIDVQAPGNNWVKVTGATVVSLAGELLTLDIGGIGSHAVAVGYEANVAPVITSFSSGATGRISISENTAAVTTITATDANIALGDSVRYSIASGGDGGAFAIDAQTGALRFVSAPDFETPTDSNRDNSYVVTVVATDARGLVDTQTLTVDVIDVAGITRTGSLGNDTLTGTGEGDTLDGSWGNDVLNGLAGNDILIGSMGNDTINGGDGNDVIDGGSGRDVMTGGAGADVFRFTSTSDSPTSSSSRDIITDFQRGVDKIDLSAIDANTSIFAGGDQAFTLRAGAGASFTGAAQLRFAFETIGGVEYTVIYGNVNSGTAADFSIALVGRHDLTTADFIL
ncbi:cadherin domain-containing protein [uncultured Sphingomonas sp.]|uniref:M10 family metallopeptidase C-terminal domain-containing protein n=1 Tax=uncultured Sphingomonas sp. TaxID=158754 RepID=UPI0025D330B7|nr:cadherin domain-containing protein [uncultured Sphingomonas sp.]